MLGIVAGEASVTLGGPQGRTLELRQGDVVVLPDGTGQCRVGSHGLLVVGAYAHGWAWDLRWGDPGEHEEVWRTPKPYRFPMPTLSTASRPAGRAVGRLSLGARRPGDHPAAAAGRCSAGR